MILNFILVMEGESAFRVMDVSVPESKGTPDIINSMQLNILSDKLPNNGITGIDIINYIKTYNKPRELYHVDSNLLGLGYNTNIPDGLYTVSISVNGNYDVEKKFVKYSLIKEKINELLNEVELSYDITKYSVQFTSNVGKYKQELLLSAVTLLNNLFTQAGNPVESEINDTLNRLNNILNIYNNASDRPNIYK